MTKKSIIECERKRILNMKNFQIPHSYKKYGIGLFIISLVLLLTNRFFIEIPELRIAAKYGMLIGLLIVSISKEKIEDELVAQIRMQSYSLAFIMGVVFTLFASLADKFLDSLFAINKNDANDNMVYYSVVWMLVCIQVCYFEVLKRMYK